MASQYPATVIVRHPRENPRKCSVLPLRGRPDVLFLTHPVKERPALEGYVRLAAEGPPLTAADADRGILLLDGSWRWTAAMTRDFRDVPARSLHGWITVYPRVSKQGTDPENGLASVEALFVAYHLLGRPTTGLLDHYFWAGKFLRANDLSQTPPRFVPENAFPPYTFVPGRAPHPLSDPAGHLYGRSPEHPAPIDPISWKSSRAYLYGIDLFNHGYYWEAHEVWEGLWREAGRTGRTADFLKGLIKLAAAGVKVRQGEGLGVASHAARAAELFRGLAQQLGGENPVHFGLPLHDLLAFTAQMERQAADVRIEENTAVKVVFPFVLQPAK